MIVLHVMQGDMVLEAASTAHAVATAPLVDTPQWPISLAPLQTTAWRVLLEALQRARDARAEVCFRTRVFAFPHSLNSPLSLAFFEQPRTKGGDVVLVCMTPEGGMSADAHVIAIASQPGGKAFLMNYANTVLWRLSEVCHGEQEADAQTQKNDQRDSALLVCATVSLNMFGSEAISW